MANEKIKGRCFCGAVELIVTGEPSAMGYCHCKDCAAWSATPINSYSFWGFDQLEITKGLENIQTFSKTDHSKRKFCKNLTVRQDNKSEKVSFTSGDHYHLILVYWRSKFSFTTCTCWRSSRCYPSIPNFIHFCKISHIVEPNSSLQN